MSYKVRQDNELEKIVKNNPKKLICVDFSADNCPPCAAAAPWWDSLVPQFQTCYFVTVKTEIDESSCRKFSIKATPTFVFILAGSEVWRCQGCNKAQILETINKYKPMGAFDGHSHTLGDVPNQNDFFANLAQSPSQPKVQPKAKPIIPENAIPNPNKGKQLIAELENMSFTKEQVSLVISHLGQNASLDDCVAWLAAKQESESNPQPSSSPAAPPEANGPQHVREFNESESLMLESLIEMGFGQEVSAKAILHSGSDSIDRCLDYINAVQEGRELPPSQSAQNAQARRPQRTQEEIDAQVKALRERGKQKEVEAVVVNPKQQAVSELERRKQVQESLEQKKKLEELKKEQELREIQKQKMADKMARDKTLAKIAANRNAAKGQSPVVEEKKIVQEKAPTVSSTGQCTLKCVFSSNGSSKVLNLLASDTLNTVFNALRGEGLIPNDAKVLFETVFPRSVFSREKFNSTLADLQLCPRGQLKVTFQ